MKVSKNCVVTLDFSVADTAGNLLDEGARPLVYLHGGYDGIFPKIEARLEGKSVGESLDITLSPEESFGEYEDDLVEIADRSEFPNDIELGMEFSQGEDEDAMVYAIVEISKDKVVLDANHPFAGIEIAFSCTVTHIREATKQELSQGFANI